MSSPTTGNSHAYNEPANREIGTLFSSELWWRDRHNEIGQHGYRLRSRYHRSWRSSKSSGKDFYFTEDGQPFTLRPATDATRIRDSAPVMLKKVIPEEGPHGVAIIKMFSSPGVEGNSCVPLLDLIDSERSRSQRFSRPRSFSRRDATADSPEGLDPTLSSWLKNINKLSNLIDRLQNLASTAPPEHRPHLYKQVAALRATFKKQQDRCIHFLQLTEEYANRYLLDISAEIQQQSSFLDMLEKRLDMAKTLRGQAVDLRKSYENGTVNAMKKVRETALSQPLPEDFDLLSEVDFVLKEIRRCYIELDKFWIEEIRRAVKAVKTRRVDQEDIQRWTGFQAGLEETIKSWKANAQGGVQTLARVNRPQELEIGKVASRISLGIGLLEESLECVRMSASVEFSKTSMPLILEVNMRFSLNSESCLGFLRRCVDFGKLIAVSCGSFSNDNDCRFARVRGSDDVREGITGLKSETGGEDRSENAEGNVQVSRKFAQAYEKALSLEMKVDGKLHRLLELVSSWMTRYDAPPELLSVGELRKVSYGWAKGRDSVRGALASLTRDGMDGTYMHVPFSSGSPRSRVMGWMRLGL